MDKKRLINANIAGHSLLPTPREVTEQLPASERSLETVAAGRRAVCAVPAKFRKPLAA